MYILTYTVNIVHLHYTLPYIIYYNIHKFIVMKNVIVIKVRFMILSSMQGIYSGNLLKLVLKYTYSLTSAVKDCKIVKF